MDQSLSKKTGRLLSLLSGKKIFAKFLLFFAGAFLILGIPTSLVPNPIFTRMLAPSILDYFFLITTSILAGLYLALPSKSCPYDSHAAGGSALGLLAFACPICNMLLVSIIGASFLLTFFDPLRPFIGAFSLLVLLYAISKKLEG